MDKGILTDVIGDVTTPQRINDDELVFIPHVCNNYGKMGAGVALAIKRKWYGAFEVYENHIKKVGEGWRLGETIFWNSNENGANDNVVICNMIAQNHFISSKNPRPLNYSALVRCMNEVKSLIISYKNSKYGENRNFVIHAPMFGGELAGGNFEFIKCLIEDIWIGNNIDVVIYKYVG